MKKRLAVLIMVVMVLASVFAQKNYNWKIKGYYGSPSSGGNVLLMNMYDYTASHILNNGTVELTEIFTKSKLGVFDWVLESDYQEAVTVSFEFGVMQANVDGEYYRPGYTVSFALSPLTVSDCFTTGYGNTYKSGSTTYDLNVLRSITQSDSTSYSGTWSSGSFSYTKAHGNIRYSGTNKITYTLGNVTAYKADFYKGKSTLSNQSISSALVCKMTRKGSCSIQITDYFTDSEVPAGLYEYKMDVTVTFATK